MQDLRDYRSLRLKLSEIIVLYKKISKDYSVFY